jgi:hypothetical protein
MRPAKAAGRRRHEILVLFDLMEASPDDDFDQR